MKEELWVHSWQEQQISSSPKHPDQLRDPPSLLFSGYAPFFPLGCEAVQLPESSANIKNERRYTCAPRHVSIMCTGTSSFSLTMTVMYLFNIKFVQTG
jgi:hypothetical protein